MKLYENKVSFLDANNERVNLEIKIKERNTNLRPYLSICSEYGQRYFKPANDAQRELLLIWEKYHLNDIKRASPFQQSLLDKEGIKDYDAAKRYLLSLNAEGRQMSFSEAEKWRERESNFNNVLSSAREDFKKVTKVLENINKSSTEWIWLKGVSGLSDSFKKVIRGRITKKTDLQMDLFNKKGYFIYISNSQARAILTAMRDAAKNECILDDDFWMAYKDHKLSCAYWCEYDEGQLKSFGQNFHWPLPIDLEGKIDNIIDRIEEAEETYIPYTDEQLNILEIQTGMDKEVIEAISISFEIPFASFADLVEEGAYDDFLYNIEGIPYYVGTDEDLSIGPVTTSIKDLLWTFRPSSLASETGLPIKVFEVLEGQYEGANETILSLIERTCGIDDFVKSAIAEDGISHFINSYDGELKDEYKGLLIIRQG